jgi:putative ATP-binding cassette transporter
LLVTCPERPFRDAEILAVLAKVGLEPVVERVGGLDADVHGPSALSPAEQRLLVLARVLLAAPRFVFLDRMGGDLSSEQVQNLYRRLNESSISYLSIGDRHSLLAYHDTVLEIDDEGSWRITPVRGGGAVDGPLPQPLVSDTASRQP